MGLFKKLFRSISSKSKLEKDIYSASDWIYKALTSSGYNVSYSVEGMKEIDRFFDNPSGRAHIDSKPGTILFALGSFVGETAIKVYGGEWIVDDEDPEGEVSIAVKLTNGSMIFPVIKCMERYKNGVEDSIFAYLSCLK